MTSRPGERAPFTIQVPVDDLPITGDPGVYWFGVHALGTSADGRDLVADGRARTFIPLVPKSARPPTARCRCPSYSPCATAPAGPPTAASTARPAGCNLTAPDGRLSRLADFGGLGRRRSADLAASTPPCSTRCRTSAAATRRCPSAPAPQRDRDGDDGDDGDDTRPTAARAPSPHPRPPPARPSEEEQARANARAGARS